MQEQQAETAWTQDNPDGTQHFFASNESLYSSDIEVDKDGVATASAILNALMAVTDPEIGIDIVNLGLIYDVAVTDGVAYVVMTLTSIGCPLSELLHSQVTLVCHQMPGITAVDVEFTFSPPWSTDMLSEDARLELRARGMSV